MKLEARQATGFSLPPGVVPNYVNPEFRGKEITILAIVCSIISSIFILIRLYTRIWIIRSFGKDDACILFAWAIVTTSNFLCLDARESKMFGVHIWDIPLSKVILFAQKAQPISILYAAAVGFAKLSLLFFYLRISPDQRFRTAVWISIAIVGASTIAFVLPQIFSCRPLKDSWNPTLFTIVTRKCISTPTIQVAVAGTNLATDILVILLPVPMLRALQMPKRQKFAVGLWFAIGSLTCIVGILRLKWRLDILKSQDYTWDSVSNITWTIIELNLMIVCGCLTTFRALLGYHAPWLIGSSQRDRYRGGEHGSGSNPPSLRRAWFGRSARASSGEKSERHGTPRERDGDSQEHIYDVESGGPRPKGPAVSGL